MVSFYERCLQKSHPLMTNILSSVFIGAHRFLGAFFVVLKSCAQTDEDFGGGFEKSLGFRFGDSVAVFAQVVNHLGEHLLDVSGMNTWVTGIFRASFHFFSIGLGFVPYNLD